MASDREHSQLALQIGIRLAEFSKPSLAAGLDRINTIVRQHDYGELEAFSAAHFFAHKGARSYRAYQHLWIGGFPEDAAIIGRTLLEIFLKFSFMFADDSKRQELAKKFGQYDIVNRGKLGRRIQSWSDSHQKQAVLSDPRHDPLEKQTADLGDEFGGRDWTGLDLRGVAIKLGDDALQLYDMAYWEGSNLVHSNATAMNFYQSYSKALHKLVDVPERPLGEYVPLVIAATGSFIGIIDIYNRVFSLNLQQAIQEAAHDLHQINVERGVVQATK